MTETRTMHGYRGGIHFIVVDTGNLGIKYALYDYRNTTDGLNTKAGELRKFPDNDEMDEIIDKWTEEEL